MASGSTYDAGIIGGGLAGLSSAILLARLGHSVALFEKEKYPLHKVCGEYISLESYDLVCSLGIKLHGNVPIVKKLLISSPSGSSLSRELPLGGFGISRYKLDMDLMNIARSEGVHVFEATKVTDVQKDGSFFQIVLDERTVLAKAVCAAYGKRSNLDIRWKRTFTRDKPGPLNNFIGVKYHAKLERQRDLIELHNFKNGYCGISPIEDGKSCICYLTTADTLKKSNSNISLLEKEVLSRNRYLSHVFTNAELMYDRPLTISQVSFEKKRQVENGILFIGDAASMIAPLCGNGMSMALHAGRMAASSVDKYLKGEYSLAGMGNNYNLEWNRAFRHRLSAGRLIQRLFRNEWLTNTSVRLLKRFPTLLDTIVKQTHG